MSKRLYILLLALVVSACDGQQTPGAHSSGSSSSSSSGQGPNNQTTTNLPLLKIDVMSRQATVQGPILGGGDLDLLVSSDSDCHLATYSICADVQWLKNISLPYTLKNLKNGQNYWGQLFQQGKAVAKNTGFRPDALVANSGIVNMSVADDGSYLLFDGFYEFTKIGPHTGPGVIVDAQTGQPGAFPLVEGDINTVITDEKGGWYIGGSFTSVGGVTRKNIAHIDARGEVTAFNPDINGPVNKLVLAPDGVLVLGQFNQVNVGIRKQIALLNPEGKLHDWTLENNGEIKDILLANNTVYVAGSFSTVNQTARVGVASLNYKGGLTNLNPSKTLGFTLDYVTTLAYDQGTLYIAGQFALPRQIYKDNLIAVDAEGNRVNFNPEISGSVSAVAVIQNSVYISGYFYAVNGEKREFLASLTKTGQLNPWHPEPNAPALFIQEYNKRIYLAGHFDSIFGVRRSKFAALNLDGTLSDWNPDAAPAVQINWDNRSNNLGAQLAFWQDKAYLAANKINFFGGVDRTGTFMLNQDGSLVGLQDTPQNRLYGRVDIKNTDTFEFNNYTCDINFTDWEGIYSPDCPKNHAAFSTLTVAQYDDVTAVLFQPNPQVFELSALVIPRINTKAYIYPSLNTAFAGSIGGLFQKDEIRVSEHTSNFITSYQIERIFIDSAGKAKTIDFNHTFNNKPLKATYFNERILVGGMFTKIGEADITGLAAFTKEGILIKSVKFPEVYTSVSDIQIRGNIMYLVLAGVTTATIDLSAYPDLINQ